MVNLRLKNWAPSLKATAAAAGMMLRATVAAARAAAVESSLNGDPNRHSPPPPSRSSTATTEERTTTTMGNGAKGVVSSSSSGGGSEIQVLIRTLTVREIVVSFGRGRPSHHVAQQQMIDSLVVPVSQKRQPNPTLIDRA